VTRVLIDVVQDHGLTQVINKPTHLANILDLFLTNSPAQIQDVAIILGLSDHEAVIIRATVPSSYNCTRTYDFSCGTTRFYSVSEVQIHAWFRPMATHGSQRGYKYNHA